MALNQAQAYYNERLVRQAFESLGEMVGEKRRNQQADVYYNEGLQKRVYSSMYAFKEQEQVHGSLTVKANLFRNKNA